MIIKDKFKEGRELILEQLMKHSLDKDYKPEEPSRLFCPVKVQLDGRNFASKGGIYVFKNRGAARSAVAIAASKCYAGALLNSDGIYERVRGKDGMIKILFKDIFLTKKESELLSYQFVAYLKSSVKFEEATLEEFIINNHNVKLK